MKTQHLPSPLSTGMTTALPDSHNVSLYKVPLFPEFERYVVPVDRTSTVTCTRRQALRLGVWSAGTLFLSVGSSSLQRAANADSFFDRYPWLAKKEFANNLAWYCDETVGKEIPADPDELGLEKVADPCPSKSKFHNSHAEPLIVGKERHHFPSLFGENCRFHVSIHQHLRADVPREIPDFKDLASHELRRIRHEAKIFSAVLYPCGERACPAVGDRTSFHRACDEYGVDPDRLKLDYVRPFNDGRKAHLGFGVRSQKSGEKDLLIL
ncbi:MAG: hypothetical protein HZA46_04170 [Planctomycetales bacterium]|nr:hypothetical protein [Planctomycetales bacterium]